MTIDRHRSQAPGDGRAGAPRLGRRRLIAGAGAFAGVAAVDAIAPGRVHAAVPAGASNFHILPEGVRLADTRPKHRAGYSFTHLSDRLIRVRVAGRDGVPADASAVVLTVTSVNFGEPSHVTVHPTGQGLPNVSNLNLLPWAVNANLVTVKLGTNGSVDVASHAGGDKIVDVIGYYRPTASKVREGRYISLSAPQRVHDSRRTTRPYVGAGSYTTVDVTAVVPSDASAIMANLTIADAQGSAHFTAMPIDAAGPPTTSSLNTAGRGDTRAAAVVVPVESIGGKRRIKVYAHVSAFVIVDVFGYYTGPSSGLDDVGLFVPLSPSRLLDTRDSPHRLWPGWQVEVPLPAAIRSSASAVVANVTGVVARAAGHFTVAAARRPIPGTSNVNWTSPGAIVPNHVVTTVTKTHGLTVFSSHGAHALVDLAGYFTGTPESPTLGKPVNPPPPPAPPSWVMRLPRFDGRFGRAWTSTVLAGHPDAVTNAGYSWHWSGTGYIGEDAHVSVFAHRTEHGGPYRWLHEVIPGDEMVVWTNDGREYRYRMVRRDLVTSGTRAGPSVDRILAATRLHPGPTFSMIACTRTDLLPTSLDHRLIVTFEFVSWREV